MKFNTKKEGEQISSYESDGNPTLYNPKVTTSFWSELLDGFDGEFSYAEAISNPLQISNMNLIELENSFFLLEFSDGTKRDDIMNQLKNKIRMRNTFMSEELEEKRQIPGVSGYFEREGKSYIILHSYLRNTDEINSELGIYKGSIINPELYYGVHEDVEGTMVESNKIVSDTLNKGYTTI